MRTIKFRVFNEQMYCMEYFGLGDTVPYYYKDENSSATKYEVMQFTGLLDKNGKEIYEGDIIEFCPIGSTNTVIGSVEYQYDSFIVNVIGGRVYRLWAEIFSKPVVIGNIYELRKPRTN